MEAPDPNPSRPSKVLGSQTGLGRFVTYSKAPVSAQVFDFIRTFLSFSANHLRFTVSQVILTKCYVIMR